MMKSSPSWGPYDTIWHLQVPKEDRTIDWQYWHMHVPNSPDARKEISMAENQNTEWKESWRHFTRWLLENQPTGNVETE